MRFAVNSVAGHTDNGAPYALAGDVSGNYNAWTPPLGAVTISATPFALANASGTAGTPRTVRLNIVNTATVTTYSLAVSNGTGSGSFAAGTVVPISAAAAPSGQVFDRWVGATVVNAYSASTTLTMPAANTVVAATYKSAALAQAVVRLVLINADTNQQIATLTDGMTLMLSALPTRNLNVQAVTNPAVVGSVRFDLSVGTDRTESAAPYALAGDTDGNYWAWTPPVGALTITATPFSGVSASGTRGTSATVRLNVVQ